MFLNRNIQRKKFDPTRNRQTKVNASSRTISWRDSSLEKEIIIMLL